MCSLVSPVACRRSPFLSFLTARLKTSTEGWLVGSGSPASRLRARMADGMSASVVEHQRSARCSR